MTGCIFCVLDDRSLNQIVASNGTCYVRLDNYPAALGHAEVVPFRHVVSLRDLTVNEWVDAFALIRAYNATASADGWTVGINDGRAAGRTVDHLHIHLIPRHYGDVPDPRGGIRAVLPGPHPDVWASGEGGDDRG